MTKGSRGASTGRFLQFQTARRSAARTAETAAGPDTERAKPRLHATVAAVQLVGDRLCETAGRFNLVADPDHADLLLLTPADLDELIEDALAAAAYNRTRDQESVPVEVVDRLLAGQNPVRVWREYRGLSLPALAEKAGLGKGYLSQIETGGRSGTVATLTKLARVLSVDLDDLLARPAA